MQAEEDTRGDHRYYVIRDNDGRVIGSTSISHGASEPLGSGRISKMAGRGQLNLDNAEQLERLVKCSLDRESALTIMRTNWQPGSSRRKH